MNIMSKITLEERIEMSLRHSVIESEMTQVLSLKN